MSYNICYCKICVSSSHDPRPMTFYQASMAAQNHTTPFKTPLPVFIAILMRACIMFLELVLSVLCLFLPPPLQSHDHWLV